MPSSLHLVILVTASVAAVVEASASRNPQRLRSKPTKKPPQGGEGAHQTPPSRLGARQTTTIAAVPTSAVTEETTESPMDAYSSSHTDSTTYPSEAYSSDYHTEAMLPPGVGPRNYTLDYNECFFNFCECCPPERGPPGPIGEKGSTGPAGQKGEAGPQGPAGETGLPGAPGLRGDKGDPGDMGEKGLPGDPGLAGMRGDKGEPGLKGDTGDIGLPGLKGDPGDMGEPGLNGTKGETGEPGMPGLMGPVGYNGTKGEKGEKGEMAEPLTADKGEKGDKGEPGPPGPKGDVGMPGLNGTDGLPGTKGEKGDLGPLGPQGQQGMKGPPGQPGQRGMPGMKGIRGVKGLRGQRGVKGSKGESFVQKRSAFSVGLFPSRSFPPPGQPVRFDKVMYNEEGHWDTNTSKFNCTYGGVYVFSYYITVRNRPLRAALLVNGIRKLRTRDSLYGQDIDQASNMALIRLSPGDQVWLETVRDWNGVYSSSEDDSTFSGFLLFADATKDATAEYSTNLHKTPLV
ncbi:otolin-1-A [Brachyhypopomus gauderio]|uniref:otolin-1-A n=1 Tax=Brachyhypopomus gauderio TaxID=698409 RepID=UPI004042828D